MLSQRVICHEYPADRLQTDIYQHTSVPNGEAFAVVVSKAIHDLRPLLQDQHWDGCPMLEACRIFSVLKQVAYAHPHAVALLPVPAGCPLRRLLGMQAPALPPA